MLLEKVAVSKMEVRKNLRGWVTLEAWEIDGARYEIRYTYDDAGNRTSMTYPDGTTVSFAYNERNQLVRIPGFFEGLVAGVWTDNASFRYDANGFLIGMRAVNGIETTFQPDQRNRLTQISSPPLTLTYTYTPGGNVASITDASSGEPFTLTYGYDGANRLISAQVHMPTGIETVQYVYDALGNRIKEAWTDARGAIDYSYLPGNYLIQRGSTSYSWGTYGQLILTDDQPNVLGGETNYDYNARRLMTQVRVNGSPVAQFFYDPYGRRVKIVEGDTTTITLYSGNDIVYEVKTQPGQPTVTTKYLAINRKYLAKVVQEGTNPPQTYFYHVDLVGSVRAITGSQGQVVARFEYEPFGVTVQASGTLADEVHKFTGKPEDVALDLYYFNARYYDPLVGRFIQQDPARSGLNWYLYGGGNPLRYRDPTGLVSEGEASALVVSLGPYIVYWADHYDISVALLSGVLYDELTRTSRIYGLAEIPAAFFGMETSVGIASMKPATAKILEDKGLVPAAGSNWERVWRLSDPKSAVRYAAANLRSIADELATKGDPRLVTDEMIATNYSLSRVEPVTYRRGIEAIVSGRKLMLEMAERWRNDLFISEAIKRPWKTKVTLE